MSAVRSTPGGRVETPFRPPVGVPSQFSASRPRLCGRVAPASRAARPSGVDAVPAGPRDHPPTALTMRAPSCGPAPFLWRRS